MRFVHPYFLWSLLFLAIPIVIHLYNFRKYKTLYFSSLTFLKKIELETQVSKNLKHKILLISRILCLLFAILAFAQPYLPVKNSSVSGGNPMLAIYLDNSFSMGQIGTEGELISEARESAKRILNSASTDTRFLLVTNEMSGIEQRVISKTEALDRLDKIELSPMVRDIGEVLDWQRNFIEQYSNEKEKISTVQYVILSDFQENSFQLKDLSEDVTSFYYPIQFVPQNSGNLSVDSIWFSEPNIKIGQNNELNVLVKNFGDKDVVNGELHVEIGAIQRDIFVDVPAKNSKTTTIHFVESNVVKNSQKYRNASATIRDKQMFFDDQFFFTYSPKEFANVLIIDGMDASSNVQKVYNLDNFYRCQTVSQGALTLDHFANMDLVVLNGCNDLASGMVQMLEDFKTEQGSLLVLPGSKINLGTWNSAMNQLGLPSFGSVVSDGSKLREISFNDLFFKPVFDKSPDNISMPALKKLYSTRANSSSVALLKSQNGLPVFSRSLDSKCFVFTSSLSPEFSSFTSNALFTTLLLRVGEMSNKQRPYYLTIGSDSKYPLFTSFKSEKPIHLKNKEIDFIPIKEKLGNIDYISIQGQEAVEKLKAGIFDIVAEVNLGKLALNYNRKESDCKQLDIEKVKQNLEEKGLKNVITSQISEGQSLAKLDLEKPFEYWRIFVLLSLLFLLTEMAIIKWWKN